jgi:hypothetical protein
MTAEALREVKASLDRIENHFRVSDRTGRYIIYTVGRTP